MYIMSGMRTVFMICVPLFLLLTGYLMNKKELSIKFYKGILHTLELYFVISIFCILFKYFVQHQNMNLYSFIEEILNFSAAPYAWYIEMYIGLFLLIPFLNVLYYNLNSNYKKLILIGTLFLMVSLPTLFNAFELQILPCWWTNIYPILYYFIGCYLKEYELKIPFAVNILLIIFWLLLCTFFNITLSHKSVFALAPYNNWEGWQNVISSVLVFILIKNRNFSNIPDILKIIIQKISILSLGIYLNSWILDKIVYNKINNYSREVTDKLLFFPLAVLLVFLGSTLLSGLANKIIFIVSWIFSKHKN